jgi:hypothetical protein
LIRPIYTSNTVQSRHIGMSIADKWAKSLRQAQAIPLKFKDEAFSEKYRGGTFYNSIQSLCPSVDAAKDEVEAWFIDQRNDSHSQIRYLSFSAFEEVYSDGTTAYGLSSFNIEPERNLSEQSELVREMAKLMPHVIQLALEGAALLKRLEGHESVSNIRVYLLLYRPGYDSYVNPDHTDHFSALHVPILNRGTTGTTTIRDSSHSPTVEFTGVDEVCWVPALPMHTAKIQKLRAGDPDAVRVMMNIRFFKY